MSAQISVTFTEEVNLKEHELLQMIHSLRDMYFGWFSYQREFGSTKDQAKYCLIIEIIN